MQRYEGQRTAIEIDAVNVARDWLDYAEQNSVPVRFLEMVRRDYILAVAGARGEEVLDVE